MTEIRRISVVIPVYRDSSRAITLVHALLQQQLRHGCEVQIVLVDDGSDDETAGKIDMALADIASVRLVRLETNQGRSVARNTGALTCNGDVLIFIDCDCLPADAQLLASHLAAMQPDVVVTTGPVTGNGDGFWHHYQTEASERRARWHANGIFYAGSSQNMMIRREAFLASGGFDPAFRTYGFEDRDLLLRLASLGRIEWAASATVKHTDALDMWVIARKMKEAGGEGARLFSERHPDAYRQLGYGALDTRMHPWLVPFAGLGRIALVPLAYVVDRAIHASACPYTLIHGLVKITTGLSYLVGTREKRS